MDQPTARWALQVAGRSRGKQVSRGGSHVANMCNAVVLGAVRWRSQGVVTVDTPAPASCMKSLSGGGQNSGRLLSVSQKS